MLGQAVLYANILFQNHQHEPHSKVVFVLKQIRLLIRRVAEVARRFAGLAQRQFASIETEIPTS